MKTRSITLPPGRLQPGMTTAAAILTRQSEELLPANTTLDEEMIDGIRRRLIRCVVVSKPDERDPETIAREIDALEQRLAFIFRGDGSEARADLQKAVSLFRHHQAQ